jgi:hypothetical protein
MASAAQIRSQVREYLAGNISPDDFEDWFLANNWNAHLHADAETVSLVHQVEGLLLDFSADAINEAKFREELTRIAHPFQLRFGVVSVPQEVSLFFFSSEKIGPRLVSFSAGTKSGFDSLSLDWG